MIAATARVRGLPLVSCTGAASSPLTRLRSESRESRVPCTSNAIVGVDFGAPRRACDQRRKIVAIAAYPTDWCRYRIGATGMNARLANDPPGWTAKELLDELLTRPVRIAAFDFPFCIPDALLRDQQFAADVGYEDGAFRSW
jgi:hypothetical protein